MHVASDVILRIEFAVVALQREKNLCSTKYKYTLQLFLLYHSSIFYFCFFNYIMTRRFKEMYLFFKKTIQKTEANIPHNSNLEGQGLMNLIIVSEVNRREGIGASDHVFVLSRTKPITFELLICVLSSLAHNVYCGVSHSISLVSICCYFRFFSLYTISYNFLQKKWMKSKHFFFL